MYTKKCERAFFARRIWCAAKAICLITLFGFLATSGADAARPNPKEPGAVIVIGNDIGGSVRTKFNQIQRINRLGQRVEIRGGRCLSSCTMYLGAHNVCVSPRTIFGFHGPYRLGSKLSHAEFEQWSRVIAQHYPQSLQRWYMKEARHQTFTMSRLSGRELIRLGVQKCE